jgi:DNA repair exonuclease SbcCD ATPase subunit
MGGLIRALTMAALATCGWSAAAQAGEDESLARAKEMLHRTQEALRQAQSDNADLGRAKADAEQKLQATTKELEAARGVSKAELALRGQLQATKAAQDDLTHKLGDETNKLSALNAKLSEAATRVAADEKELAQVKHDLELSKTADTSCEAKNLKLYGYSQEVLQAYRNKGVWAALSQKDPVFGLKEVDVENVVQEYKVKLASEKIKP